MGWKALKERFGIRHYVVIEPGEIHIGSGYVSDLVVIDMATGMMREKPTFKGFIQREYPEMMDAMPDELLALIKAPDTFKQSLPVFTYEGGDILELQCEEYGWPNVTHDGRMMYNNTFFKEKEKAIQEAIEDAECGIKNFERNIESINADLEKQKGYLLREKENLMKLTAMKDAENE